MRKIMTLFLLLKNIKRKKCRPRHLLVITSDVPSALLPTVGGIGWKQPRRLKKLPIMQRYFIMYLNITFSTNLSCCNHHNE